MGWHFGQRLCLADLVCVPSKPQPFIELVARQMYLTIEQGLTALLLFCLVVLAQHCQSKATLLCSYPHYLLFCLLGQEEEPQV